ncbi:4-carboxymuconolactone decarboxylase [Rhodoligotrophos appendicifer]|uniref:carboxymuconolactone decarboxylase family protein n=1 Tax=Rhodoligotrophos appendicifer TaxID=987056 RepID=UPI00118600C1|nr:carboxymuconolactone decarboxylase family protein [Rhodoligotrophos appendicifer]
MNKKRETGRKIMSEVLGKEYFERREKSYSPFNTPIRVFSEENCFGDVWDRPGLERKTRSLLLLATLTALNRITEFKFHVRSAINNGCTVDEIQEVLYQCILYCGLPAAVESYKAAEEVLTEMGQL